MWKPAVVIVSNFVAHAVDVSDIERADSGIFSNNLSAHLTRSIGTPVTGHSTCVALSLVTVPA